MKLRSLLFILPILFQTLPSQQPGAVEGIVVDATSGQPLSGVTVQLRKYGTPPYLLAGDTRFDGTFVFRNVPAGAYQIEALRGGYIPGVYGERTIDVMPVTHTITPGQVLSGVRIMLTPGGVIFGRLIDDRGEAVAGASVEALKTTYKDGERQRTVVQTVLSNDLGEYRLFMLTPGEYVVRARDFISKRFVSVYFPGTIDVKEARRMDLRAGEVLGGIDLPSFPTRTVRVTGTVQGTNGDPTGVSLSALNDTQATNQVVDPISGAFEFKHVIPGSYMLVARSSERRAALSVEVRSVDLLNYSITLGSAGHMIPARIRIEGHPPGDDPELEKLYFAIQRESPIAGLEPERYSPFANGRLTFDLLSGNYRIHLSRPDDFYIKSMTLGGVNILNQGLRVESSSDVPLEIVVASNPGSVEGRAVGKNVTVVLIPNAERRGQRDFYRSAKPAASGEFRFEKVPPGDYKLFVWQAENGGPWRDPEYVVRYEDRGIPIRIEEGARIQVTQPLPLLD